MLRAHVATSALIVLGFSIRPVSGEAILTYAPTTIELNTPTVIHISASALDEYVLSLDHLVMSFDGEDVEGGTPTDDALTLVGFEWLGGLSNPGGQCASGSLPNPFSECGTTNIPLDRPTPIAVITVVGTEIGEHLLAPNFRGRWATDGHMAIATIGDPTTITVVPEPMTLGMVAFGCLVVMRRGHVAGRRNQRRSRERAIAIHTHRIAIRHVE